MKEFCECCEGVEAVAPGLNENRPGLSALVYRAHTHATFMETMLARLSSHSLPVPEDGLQTGLGAGAEPRPLLALRTRERHDASIAFLDAWATVADVLTFYQERIANEGYLRTATERRSVIELARLLGYRPRPGVAASVYLAYTLEDKARVTIAAGSRAQSTPAPDELPQIFETAEDLSARSEWNVFAPRLTRPQSPREVIRARRPLYLKGTSANLKPNDPLLIDFDGRGQSLGLFRVIEVEVEQAAGRTKVTLQPWQTPFSAPVALSPSPPDATDPPVEEMLSGIITRYRDLQEFKVTANTATVRRVLAHLDKLERQASGLDDEELRHLVESVLPPLREEHGLARENNFTKLEPWIGGIVSALNQLSEHLAHLVADAATDTSSATDTGASSENEMPSAADASLPVTPPAAALSALLKVFPLLSALAAPPSVQPRSKQQLEKNVAGAFAPTSDNLPKLLGALLPGVRSGLYKALDGVPVTQPTPAVVYALRTRASVFGNSAPLEQVRDERGVLRSQREWTLFRSSGGEATENFVITLTTANAVATPTEEAGIHLLIFIQLIDPTGQRVPITSGRFSQRYKNSTFNIPLPPESGDEVVVVTVSNALNPSTLSGNFEFRFTVRAVTVALEIDEAGFLSVENRGSNPSLFSLRGATGGAEFDRAPSDRKSTNIIIAGGLRAAAGRTPTESPHVVSLDASYNKILPGSWAVIERPPADAAANPAPPEVLFRRIERVGEGSRADYGMTAKGTQLTIRGEGWIQPARDEFDVIRNTTVFVESEPLELAEEPIDPVVEDVCGNEIELAGLVGGLEAGRWMLVTGERTDITQAARNTQAPTALAVLKDSDADRRTRHEISNAVASTVDAAAISNISDAQGDRNVDEEKGGLSGVAAAELVMLSGVKQSFDPALPGDRTHTTLLLARPLAYCYKRDTLRIYGNVVRATHGETRTEALGSGDASKDAQSFALRQSPLTYVSAPTTSGVESTLAVRVNDVLWHETDTTAGLTPLDRNYVTKTDDAGITTVVFGNGREGARLPTGHENVKATYRAGIGKGGNLKAGQINQPATKPQGVSGVVNPLAATGGADRESRDEARRNAPLAVLALDRLVSARDYEDFARTFAGVAKASATRLSDGRRQVVHLTIAGAGDIPISKSSDLYRNLREALHRFGDPFQPFQVDTRFLKTLVVCARVRVHPDYLWEAVEPKVRAALLERFSFDRRNLGQDALLSEAIAAAQGIEGVVYVDVDTFDHIAEGITPADLLSIGEDLGLRARVRASPARIDATSLDPAARIRPAQLALLTPLVPDTLLLREIKG
jgi:hypothetical protein